VQLRIIVQLALVELSPTHEHRPDLPGTHPIFKVQNHIVEPICAIHIGLRDAGQLGAEIRNFGVQLGLDKGAEFINDVEVFINFHSADFNDLHLAWATTAPTRGFKVIDDEMAIILHETQIYAGEREKATGQVILHESQSEGNQMEHIVFLTGAGMSAESGLKTFRGAGGLWEGRRLEEVATPEAWAADPAQVTRFYNERRQALLAAEPNAGHLAIAALERIPHVRVSIITQNVDDLHERAGSSSILHLHGELRKSRTTGPSGRTYLIDGWALKPTDRCPEGHVLRPHVVWFGEAVPAMEEAWHCMQTASEVVVVGTSLLVYPAAGLLDAAPAEARIVAIDPHADELPLHPRVQRWAMPASAGCARYLKRKRGDLDATD